MPDLCLLYREKDSVDAVIIQTMPYGRNFCIFDDADQRVLGGMSQVATVVAYAFYFHNLAHSQASAGLCTFKFFHARIYDSNELSNSTK